MRDWIYRRGYITAALVLALLALGAGYALGFPGDFRYQAALVVEKAQGTYGLLELSDDVADTASPALNDLRIYAGNEEIPYTIAPLYVPLSSQEMAESAISDLGVDEAGNNVFLLKPAELTNRLEIVTPDKDFVRKVKVESALGSNPDQWATLQDGATIFDLSGEGKGANTIVNYPQTTSGLLKVTVLNEGKTALHVTGVKLGFISPVKPEFLARVKSRAHSLVSEGSHKGEEDFLIDLHKRNLPSFSLAVKTPDQNFDRNVKLEGSNDKEVWQPVTTGEIYSYDLKDLAASKLALTYPEARFRYLRLTVVNRDNRPLQVQDVTVTGANPLLVMEFDPTKQYTLLWGSSSTRAPGYDIDRIKQQLDYGAMATLAAGDVQQNKNYRPLDQRPWSERNSWLLQLALLLTVVVLSMIVVASFRRIGKKKS